MKRQSYQKTNDESSDPEFKQNPSAVVVAQLAEQVLQIPEDLGSNPAIKLYTLVIL